MLEMRCTGINCPMQVGYPVERCESKDCPFRTEPLTVADWIRSLNDLELMEFLWKLDGAELNDAIEFCTSAPCDEPDWRNNDKDSSEMRKRCLLAKLQEPYKDFIDKKYEKCAGGTKNGDAVEAVRCKDCVYYGNHPNGLCYAWTEPKDNAKGYTGDVHCVEPDEFCSSGERRC